MVPLTGPAKIQTFIRLEKFITTFLLIALLIELAHLYSGKLEIVAVHICKAVQV